MKNFLYYLGFAIVGFLIGYPLGCNRKIQSIEKETIVTKFDTIREIVEVKIPDPKVKYVFLTDSIFTHQIDSVFAEVTHAVEDGGPIPTNNYQDSISTEDYKLKYDIQTIGFLTDFNYNLDIYRKTEVETKFKKPKWIITSGISNKGNFKFGGGYRGWTVEAELKENFNQIFFGYQYQF